MRVPEETVTVEKTDNGFVATTSLIEGPFGPGNSRREAVANLEWSVRAYLKLARATGAEIPQQFRVSARRKALWVALFVLAAAGLPILMVYLWDVLH